MLPAAQPSPRTARRWRRDLLLVLAGSLVVNAVAARFIARPGYMDAYYYFGGAVQLARGQGFSEPYVWNYLGREALDPAARRWPSHLYWMPLTSLAAAVPMALAERVAGRPLAAAELFRAAQAAMLLAAALLPALSYAVSSAIGGARRHALAAAALTALSPFYFIYWSNTDAFALHALAAAGALLAGSLAALRPAHAARWALLAGLGAGLAHLARADGVLVLMVLLAGQAWLARGAATRGGRPWLGAGLLLAGYLAVMLPWLARNWLVSGALLGPGGARTLWLTSYDEMFTYWPRALTPARYFALGGQGVLASKWAALQSNLVHVFVVQGGIVAFPFAIAGFWQRRRHPALVLATVYGAALLTAMSFIVTFPGLRGGYFHSGAALLPFLAAAAPLGLDAAVCWVAGRLPHWQPERAKPVFTALLVAGTAVIAAVVFTGRVIGPDWRQPAWNQQDAAYAQAGAWLAAEGGGDKLAAVNNPPGWYYFTGQPSIVIPNGGVEDLLRAMDDFGARWLVLDANRPAGLAELYAEPAVEPRLRLRARFADGSGRPVLVFDKGAGP